MSDLGSKRALILASVFAVAVVVLSFAVPAPGALLLALLPPAALFVVLYFVVRWAAGLRDAGRGAGPRAARQILDERYARGDIGPEDYGRMRSNLETP